MARIAKMTPRKTTTAAAAPRAKARQPATKQGAAKRGASGKNASASADRQHLVCAALCAILKRQVKNMLITQQGAMGMQVSLPQEFRGKPMWLGAVRAGKSYVSYHFMPVYMFPDLLARISPGLRRRMQGKSCFNFRDVDPVLMKELEALTKAGIARMKKNGPALLAKYGKR